MSNQAITQLLHRWQNGEQGAYDKLYSLLHDQLKRIANRHIAKERNNHTLQPTALVNEAYIKLVEVNVSWQDRGHFLAICSKIMRQILIDYARGRKSRPGASNMTEIHTGHVQEPSLDLLALDSIIESLSRLDERKSKLAEMYYFGGLSCAESAACLGVTERTVRRDLRTTKAWIRSELDGI